MPTGRVMWFELPADDPERAIAFYERVFGWTIVKWNGPFDYWQITTGPDDMPGINGAIMPRQMLEQVTTDTIAVESLDDALTEVVAAGGAIARPKQSIPGIGYIAYCTDTEGNAFGLIQPDMSVK